MSRTFFRGLTVLSILLLLAINSSYATLTVIADSGDTVSIAPYVSGVVVPNTDEIESAIRQQISVLQGHTIDENQLLYPSDSNFSPGKVKKHLITVQHFAPTPIFLIGDDPMSIKWAKQNALYFKKIKAFGIITNVDNASEVQEVDSETGLVVMPVNLDGFDQVVGTKNYPFLIYKGWVVQ